MFLDSTPSSLGLKVGLAFSPLILISYLLVGGLMCGVIVKVVKHHKKQSASHKVSCVVNGSGINKGSNQMSDVMANGSEALPKPSKTLAHHSPSEQGAFHGENDSTVKIDYSVDYPTEEFDDFDDKKPLIV